MGHGGAAFIRLDRTLHVKYSCSCTALYSSLSSQDPNGHVRFSYNLFFQLVFSAGTMFFSHNKSAGTVFSAWFSAKRTRPLSSSLTCHHLCVMPWNVPMAPDITEEVAGERQFPLKAVGTLGTREGKGGRRMR